MENIIKQRVSYSEGGQHDNKSFKEYGSVDNVYVAAIAAATFVVHSFEEKTSSQLQRTEKNRVKVEAATKNRTNRVDKVPSFARTSKPKDAYTNRNLSIHESAITNLDAWEKTELLKIQKRYEKSNLTILEWENAKKSRAKRRVEEKKKDLERRRSVSWQHYQNKLARIDHVAGGARSQIEEKKMKDERKVKERAKEMRSLGVSSPKYCFLC